MFTDAENSNPSPETTDAAPQVDARIAPTPEVIELDAIFCAELALIEQTAKAYSSLGRRLHALPCMEYERFTVDAELDRELLTRYIARTKALAVHHLSCSTAPFDPSTHDLFEDEWEVWRSCYCQRDTKVTLREAAMSFRPLKAWERIVAQFDPVALERAGARLDARTIAGSFGILRDYGRQNAQMKIVRGRVEIPIRVYVEKNYRGVAHMRGDSLHELGKAIAATLARAELSPAIGHGLISLGRQLCHAPVVSRQRVDLGDGADIVQGYEHFKLYLPTGVAEALNIAIAEHRDAWDY